MATKRRTFSAEFKLDTVIEGLRGEKPIAQVCRDREITESLYYKWRDQFYDQATDIFTDGRQAAQQSNDLEDRNAVSASDVWGRFQEVILAGSGRYGADAVVAGRAYRTREGGWRGDWSLFAGGAVAATWDSRGETQAAVLAAAVDRTADTLAGQVVPALAGGTGVSAPAGGAQPGGQRMTVIGLEGYEDYGRLLRTLESLEA